MNMTLVRRGKHTAAGLIPAQPARPRYRARPRDEAQARDDRTDLHCGHCDAVIAFGIKQQRVRADAEFYLEAHHPFCRGLA